MAPAVFDDRRQDLHLHALQGQAIYFCREAPAHAGPSIRRAVWLHRCPKWRSLQSPSRGHDRDTYNRRLQWSASKDLGRPARPERNESACRKLMSTASVLILASRSVVVPESFGRFVIDADLIVYRICAGRLV